MNAAAGSYPPPAREEALGAAEDVGTLDRLQLLGTAARLFAHVPTVARAGTKLAGELARVVLGRSDVEAERRDWRFFPFGGAALQHDARVAGCHRSLLTTMR